MGTSERRPRAGWILLVVGIVLLNLIVWGWTAGYCVDYAQDTGMEMESYCTSGPAIGYPAAWTLSAVSVLVIAFALHRLLRRPVTH
ncbi:hypothetical protein [Microbacterium paulum]